MTESQQYHSLIILRADDSGLSFNTWEDWGLIPTSRPTFSMPKMKQRTVDIPGRDGVLDLSDADGNVVFENREGSFEFIVAAPLLMDKYSQWNRLYSEIANMLHGRTVWIILEDDPDYYYEGRLTVNEWRSDPTYSLITFDYSVGPYKYSLTSANELWLWDPFDFETGIIREYGDSDAGALVTNNTIHGIIVKDKKVIDDGPVDNGRVRNGTIVNDEIVPADGSIERDRLLIVGSRKFIAPVFRYVYADNLSFDIYSVTGNGPVHVFGPKELSNESANVQSSQLIPDFFFKDQEYEIEFSGNGVVAVDFREGSL